MSFEPSARVQYFSGEWCEQGAERVGVQRALRALWEAAKRCPHQDVRACADAGDALSYLASKTTRRGGFEAWRRALDLPDPALRFQAVRGAYLQIYQHLGKQAR